MYRLHDFDSGVLQQASLTLAILARLIRDGAASRAHALATTDPAALEALAVAVNRRTLAGLRRAGMLDEYFPGEESYPGTVFAAHALLASADLLGDTDVRADPGLRRTAARLAARAPGPAANQDVAAAAFLALWARGRDPEIASPESIATQMAALLGGPDGAGDFLEYGGGDLGYATVSLAYLAHMALDGTRDTPELGRLAGLVADFVGPLGGLGGEFASRSTTYWLPLGLLLAARADAGLAARFAGLDLRAAYDRLDDRYAMHYCLPALARTVQAALAGPLPAPAATSAPPLRHHPRHGLFAAATGGAALFVGTRKGGTFQLEVAGSAGRVVVDTGYRVVRGGDVYATAVLDPQAESTVDVDDRTAEIRLVAPFFRYRQLVASPDKTVALRLARRLGPRLNRYFRRRLIQEAVRLPGPALSRTIRVDLGAGRVEVEDRIEGLRGSDRLTRAPAVSQRLVPSARFWQPGEATALLESGPAPVSGRRTFELPG
jgi:hypothetical protein